MFLLLWELCPRYARTCLCWSINPSWFSINKLLFNSFVVLTALFLFFHHEWKIGVTCVADLFYENPVDRIRTIFSTSGVLFCFLFLPFFLFSSLFSSVFHFFAQQILVLSMLEWTKQMLEDIASDFTSHIHDIHNLVTQFLQCILWKLNSQYCVDGRNWHMVDMIDGSSTSIIIGMLSIESFDRKSVVHILYSTLLFENT